MNSFWSEARKRQFGKPTDESSTSKEVKNGIGLNSLEERFASAKGILDIQSGKKGTEITITITR